jgi:putative transposase
MATIRGLVFLTGEIYHVFNRGVERREVFTDIREYKRALNTLWFYRFPQKLRLSSYYDLSTKEREAFQISLTDKNKDKIVEILAYCLMPNHFHLILRQKQDNGISNFVANFSNSYTKYFNIKHKRPGSLFQGPFKAVHVETDEQLLHLSHYIHINPVSSGVIKPEKLEEYFWSSFPEYLGKSQLAICDTNWLSGFFSTKKKYKQFVFDQIGYAQKLESIKHLALE